jgi:hypothetical protein
MKFSKLALIAAIACGTYAGNVHADQANEIQLVACQCGEPVCGCEQVASCDTDCCDKGCDGGCDSCCDSGCDSGCGLSMGDCMSGCGDCCLGDPYTLFGECSGWSAGGWLQLGYTSQELPAFNTYSDHLQLQQAWLYAEKAIDTSCGFDVGGRIDYLYGTDGPNTQAFGTDPRGWDNRWDNGNQYGSALPQLYAEAGYGDMSVIAGHFYTIIGYEVVPATGNFFYSHAYTFNFSEPFTHTGVLGKYNPNDDLTVWGGYSMGWDSGFDDNGDAFLGGISLGLTDDITLTYATTAGRFAEPWTGAVATAISGYQHSIVADYDLNDSLKYVFQNDVLATDFADGTNARDTVGINQYLLKTINDCWGVGARFEWWNIQEGAAVGSSDLYALTLGVNYRPHANVIVRPEIRWDWNDDQVAVGGSPVLENGDDNQTTFGIDTILTF